MRVGGIIEFKANGNLYSAKGAFTYNLGQPKRDPVIGHDSVHGYKELPQAPRIEGAITDRSDLDLEAFLNMKDATVTLSLANGKIIVLREGFYAGEGDVTTEEGEIQVLIHGSGAEEIR